MKVNGEYQKLEETQDLQNFIEKEGFNIKRVAVELNGEIIPRDSFAVILLKEEDVLEIVAFVGGG